MREIRRLGDEANTMFWLDNLFGEDNVIQRFNKLYFILIQNKKIWGNMGECV